MKGFSPMVAIIIAAVLVVGGVATYFLMKRSPEQKVAQMEQSIDDIAVAVPDLNLSGAPTTLPDLNISALNVAPFPQVQTNKIFSPPVVNSDFSYKPDLKIDMPAAPQVDFQMPVIAPTMPTSPPASTQQAPTGGGSQPSGGAPAVDCSMFAAPPSCSYVGAPGSQGYEACKQCYPNK